MSLSRAAVATLIAVLASGQTARAEVRLQPRGSSSPSVRIDATLRGPWTPVGPVSSQTLNPGGDVVGDSYPGVAVQAGKALAAWSSAGGSLSVAVGDRSWSPTLSILATGAAGVPKVCAFASGFLVAWQGAGQVLAVPVSSEGATGVAHAIATGVLVDLVPIAHDQVALVSVSPSGALVVTLGYSSPSPTPIPIDVYRVPVTIASHLFVIDVDLQREQVRAARIAGVRAGSKSSGTSLITWWTSPSDFNYVVVGESGVELPAVHIAAQGGASYSQSLVEQALREASRR